MYYNVHVAISLSQTRINLKKEQPLYDLFIGVGVPCTVANEM